MKWLVSTQVALLALALLPTGCGDDEDDTGAACDEADQCYGGLDTTQLEGEVRCLSDNVPDGYCTHTCNTDDDCCTVEGECGAGLEYVCSPLENQNEKFCFLSCEGQDAEDYCQSNISDAFSCRSSGGGSQNRKLCLP